MGAGAAPEHGNGRVKAIVEGIIEGQRGEGCWESLGKYRVPRAS